MNHTPQDEDRPRSREQHGVADRADYDPTYDAAAPVLCDICGSVMTYLASCRILCPNCGYTRSCEDP